MRQSMMFTLLAVALAVAGTARADDKAEAKRHFDAGVSLLKAENYEGASSSFEASLEVFPTKTALFNLANCYKALARYDEALAALFRLRRDFAGRLGAEMETETVAIEKEIRNLVGSLKVEVDRPGATVLVDGREVGVSPLSKTLLLAPGSHEVTAELSGVEFGVEKVRMLAGKELTVRLKGKGGAPTPTPALQPSQRLRQAGPREGREPEPSPLLPPGEGAGDEGALHPAWFWGTLGLTAVLGGVTIGLDAAIGKASDEMKTGDDLERAEGMQAAGVTFVVLTGAAAVTTLVLAFFTDWGGEGAGTAESESASLRSPRSLPSLDSAPTVFATDTAAGLGITGRF
jgi:hypothetical protein